MTKKLCPWCGDDELEAQPGWCCETNYLMESATEAHDPHDDPEHVARLMAFAEAGGWMDGES